MTTHDHNETHRCCCKHERVRFCAKCLVCHCLDCGHEWTERCTFNHFYPWSYSGTGTYPWSYSGTSADPNTTEVVFTHAVCADALGTATCQHGD